MKQEKPNAKENARELRKKVSRLTESRDAIKSKNREKGKSIKAYQDRQRELEENRDDWKKKCKEEEKKNEELNKQIQNLETQLKIKSEDLENARKEFDSIKKNTRGFK